jgi:hypothetical protein
LDLLTVVVCEFWAFWVICRLIEAFGEQFVSSIHILHAQAWADSEYTKLWAEQFCDMVNEHAPGANLLLLDALRAQMGTVQSTHPPGHYVPLQ